MKKDGNGDTLLKTEKLTLVIEAIGDGKVRLTSSSWDNAVVILPGHALEVSAVGKTAVLKRKRIEQADQAVERPVA